MAQASFAAEKLGADNCMGEPRGISTGRFGPATKSDLTRAPMRTSLPVGNCAFRRAGSIM